MTALEALRNAELDKALEELQAAVRKAPADPTQRIFLFQLLAVMGQWSRAPTQLNVARDMDASCLPMASTYQEMLNCEVLRSEIFAGKRSPLVFGEPESWVALMLESLRFTAEGKHDEAERLRDDAYEAAPATSGEIFPEAKAASGDEGEAEPKGVPFVWLADADSRLGPMLEAIVNGRYYWIPLLNIRQVDIDPPEDLRDLVWSPAHFVWTNGGEAVGMIPTRYVGSEASSDDTIRLARKTEWTECGASTFLGSGQRILATDQGEYPLLQVRRIVFHPDDSATDWDAETKGDQSDG